MIGDQGGGVAELARRQGADVVVLDAGTSLTVAAQETAQIQTLKPPVGVVVVGEPPQGGLSAMPVLPKWGSFDGLYRAIEDARPSRNRRASDGH
jgi:hypothetical protein